MEHAKPSHVRATATPQKRLGRHGHTFLTFSLLPTTWRCHNSKASDDCANPAAAPRANSRPPYNAGTEAAPPPTDLSVLGSDERLELPQPHYACRPGHGAQTHRPAKGAKQTWLPQGHANVSPPATKPATPPPGKPGEKGRGSGPPCAPERTLRTATAVQDISTPNPWPSTRK